MEHADKTIFVNGERLADRFEIVRLLGAGGMGEVYEARDLELRENVALKTLRRSTSSDPHLLSRFKAEIQLARSVTHPNVCRVFDVARQRDILFFTMELISGETLQQRLLRGPLRGDEAVGIILQMATALNALHRANIIHRDLKPSNVLLVKEGDSIRAVLTDFGLARRFESTEADAAQTREEGIAGTPFYLAPEQLMGQDPGPPADLYTFGLVAYEMLTGHRPSAATPLSKPNEFSELPNGWDDIILRCLQISPADRFQNAGELLAALQNTKPSPIKNRKTWIAAAVLVVTLIMAAVWKLPLASVSHPATGNEVLVIPFENLSNNSDNEYFTDGLTEELITALAKSNIHVVARDSAFRLKKDQNGMDLNDLSRSLHVNMILRGSVRWFENKLRLTVHLVRFPGGKITSSEYEREKGDIFALQDDLTTAIASNVNHAMLGLSAPSLPSTWRRGTNNKEAYELYLKGRYYSNKRNKDDVIKALNFFEQAAQKDPNYAEAFVAISGAYNFLAGQIELSPAESMLKAKEASLRALELNPNLPEAHLALGIIVQRYEFDWSRAEGIFRRALDLAPNLAQSHQNLGGLMSDMGNRTIAVREFERARELDPLNIPLNASLGIIYFYAARYDEAIEQLNRTLEMEPKYFRANLFLGDCYVQKNEPDKAIESYEKAVQASGRDLRALTSLVYGYGRMGHRTEGIRLLDGEIRDRITIGRESFSPFFLAMAEAGVDRQNEALLHLEEAFARRDPSITVVKVHPAFNDLRQNPRYVDLLRKLHLSPSS